MNRKLLWLLTIFIFASVHLAEAQQARKISRVAVLGDAPPSGLLALRQGLRDLGWVEGQNIAIEYHPHQGRRDLLPSLVAELVRRKADVILAPGTVMALAAQQVNHDHSHRRVQ